MTGLILFYGLFSVIFFIQTATMWKEWNSLQSPRDRVFVALWPFLVAIFWLPLLVCLAGWWATEWFASWWIGDLE